MGKIPPSAAQVFSGVIFDVYQWDQQVYDGSYQTFEMLRRPNTLQVLPIIEDKILIAHEEQPNKPKSYTLFGGRQEQHEIPLDGAKREFLEETGMVADTWELWQTIEPYTKIDWTIYTYIARNCNHSQAPQLDPGEHIESVLVSFEELVDIATSEQFWGKEFSLSILRMHKNNTLHEWKRNLFIAR